MVTVGYNIFAPSMISHIGVDVYKQTRTLMSKLYFFSVLSLTLNMSGLAQVKSNYLYSTTMPYGTLDIRTTISSTNYFYLQEGKTFSYREISPGVRTNTYLDMTSTWDSKPYTQGNMRRKISSVDKFVMNYRLLFPLNYKSTYTEGYPLIILLHGAGERANCYYNACYHGTWSYDPNVNNPKAPTAATSKLMNNDHNLNQGGKVHMDARNLAAGKLPNDPTLAGRAFPGFVLVPQMLNIWDSLNVQDAIRLIQLIAKKYNIDDNRIYVDGLSIGGYATWQALKRAPWLFAAGLPIAAVHHANIVKQNMQGRLAHIPVWVFQGGLDKNPTPAYTQSLINSLNSAGAVVKYSLYSTLGHTCWYKAFGEPEYFKWMLSKSKANIHPYKGITAINTSTAYYPKLMLAEGFHAYQWEKDGVIISGASSNIYIAKLPGKYRARFSRVPAPTSTQWNKWSLPVTITKSSTAREAVASDSVATVEEDAVFSIVSYPNPAAMDNLTIIINTPEKELPVRMQLLDPVGRPVYDITNTPSHFEEGVKLKVADPVASGMYIIVANQGRRTIRQKIIVKK